MMFWEMKADPCQKLTVKFGNNWRPVVLKLIKQFGVQWGTSQVESNSIDTSGYAFEDTS